MMRNLKKSFIVFICLLLFLPTVTPVTASPNEEENTEKTGRVKGKEEVVYATLSPVGEEIELYVVNSLEVSEAGRIIDYGNYGALKNLTDLSELNQSGDAVEMTASEGKFYYQGNLDDAELPWDIGITYLLDGKEIDPKELPGKDGEFEIKIETNANETVNPVFFDNYLLQISFAFDGEKTKNVETEEGVLANAGKDILVTFTVMPEEEAVLSAAADVTDFELSSIDINAIPQSMSIEAPDTDEFTEDIVTLADALESIDEGVVELRNGTADLYDGTKALRQGSAEYKKGITALDNGSNELVTGSSAINEALATIHQSLSKAEDMDLGEINQVVEGLSELANALREIESGLVVLKDNYGKAYKALDGAIEGIPAHHLAEDEIGALLQSDANQETVGKLLEVYEAALTAKGTYDQIKQAFEAVNGTLSTVTDSLSTMADSMEEMVDGFSGLLEGMDFSSGMKELQEGISTLSTNYKEFHKGLVAYTDGVNELSTGYEELDKGIVELNEGSGQLAGGVSELQAGTSELADATRNMPDQVTEEIDKLLDQYDKSDFEPISFVSEKNEEVNSVQFVLKTEPIEKEEAVEVEEVKEEKSFWQKLLDLFSFS